MESVYGEKILSGYGVCVRTPDDYEQTGKQAAVWGRDILWLGDPTQTAAHARDFGYILTRHRHWFCNGESAWTGERTTPEDLAGIGTSAPYTFTWADAPAGLYDLTAVAVDNTGQTTTSNRARAAVGLTELARGKSVTASSGTTAEAAVDGDYYSAWKADKSDEEWIYVDLGKVCTVDRVNLLWGWKIHASDYTIDVATSDPANAAGWATVFTRTGAAYVTREATYRVSFDPVKARYVRMHATKRAGNQTWGGYSLTAFEVPAAAGAVVVPAPQRRSGCVQGNTHWNRLTCADDRCHRARPRERAGRRYCRSAGAVWACRAR